MLHDDMIHGSCAGTRPSRRIETDTPALPHVIAACVVEEASAWLREPLPAAWVSQLAARAETAYERNEPFRRRIRGKGDTGRDWLWAFMRHWLSARLLRRRPDLHRRLPSGYHVGRELNRSHASRNPFNSESLENARRGMITAPNS